MARRDIRSVGSGYLYTAGVVDQRYLRTFARLILKGIEKTPPKFVIVEGMPHTYAFVYGNDKTHTIHLCD